MARSWQSTRLSDGYELTVTVTDTGDYWLVKGPGTHDVAQFPIDDTPTEEHVFPNASDAFQRAFLDWASDAHDDRWDDGD